MLRQLWGKKSLTKNKLINKKKLSLKTHRRLSLKIWRRNCPGMRNVHFRFPSVDQKRGVCSLRQIQRIFLSEIQQIWERKMGKRVCSIGNLANTFKMATSKQLLLERAQRFPAEKFVEPHFGYFRDGVFTIGHFRVPFNLSKRVQVRNFCYGN